MCKESSLKKQLGFINLLLGLPPSKRSKIINHCRKQQLDAISEIILNFLNRNLTRDPSIIQALKPHKKSLHKLILKKFPLTKKKKILSSKRGAGILSVLLPLVGTLFSFLKQ